MQNRVSDMNDMITNPRRMFKPFPDNLAIDTNFARFYTYLKTMVAFLEKQKEFPTEKIQDLLERPISLDTEETEEILRRSDEYEFYAEQIWQFEEFKAQLFNSFFVAVYVHLETELTRCCHDLEKHRPQAVSLNDLTGKGVQQSIAYLSKVQSINLMAINKSEWEKISNYNLLRNCIVHCQGRLDLFSKKQQLRKFILSPESKLTLEEEVCMLSKEFCFESLATMRKFLKSLATEMSKID